MRKKTFLKAGMIAPRNVYEVWWGYDLTSIYVFADTVWEAKRKAIKRLKLKVKVGGRMIIKKGQWLQSGMLKPI